MNIHQRALQIVRAVGAISFVGNVTPHSWYRHLVRPNGKPYVVAIILLAEVVYWYRPELVKDEASGRLVGIRKEFQGDKYRTSYPDLAQRFGFGRDQVIDAVEYLEAFGVLTKEVRERVVVYGQLKGNVLFLEPVPPCWNASAPYPMRMRNLKDPYRKFPVRIEMTNPMQPSLFGTQRQPTADPADGNAESAAPLPEESRDPCGRNPVRSNQERKGLTLIKPLRFLPCFGCVRISAGSGDSGRGRADGPRGMPMVSR